MNKEKEEKKGKEVWILAEEHNSKIFLLATFDCKLSRIT